LVNLHFQVGFGTVLGPYLTALEILILIGQIAYLILLMRTAQYHQGVLSLDSKMIWRKLWWEKGIILDIIATIPFNLIFCNFILKERVSKSSFD